MGAVTVRLHQGGKVYASCEFNPTDEWKKYQARLVPSKRDINATLTIEFRGPATLWLDNASLMPEDSVGGWRPDMVAALRAIKPGIIRFGGAVVEESELNWRNIVGDSDKRKPFHAWGGLQMTGPGLPEFVRLCREVGAEPLICIAFNGKTPKEAAEQLEYFNGSTDTPLGRLRAKHGHPQPFGIKYWQIGNEVGGKEYETKLADFCRAMRVVDPSIKLLSSLPSPGVLQGAGSARLLLPAPIRHWQFGRHGNRTARLPQDA